MKYELSDKMVNNLMVFLQKTTLLGSEVGAYIEILNVFQNPVDAVIEGDK